MSGITMGIQALGFFIMEFIYFIQFKDGNIVPSRKLTILCFLIKLGITQFDEFFNKFQIRKFTGIDGKFSLIQISKKKPARDQKT